MQPTRKKLLIAVVALLIAAGVGYYAKRELSIDRCLDNGGSWSHEKGECDR